MRSSPNGKYTHDHVDQENAKKSAAIIQDDKFYDFDLTAILSPKTTAYPNDPVFSTTEICSINDKSCYRLCLFGLSNHSGTHLDYPSHVMPDGKSSSDFDYDLSGAGIIIEVPETAVSITKQFVKDQDNIYTNDIVFFKTKNSTLSKQEPFTEKYVYIEPEAAEELLKKKVRIVGIDYLSVDNYEAADLPVHRTLLSKDVLIVEGLELKHVPVGRCKIFIVPGLKVEHADGLPARVFAKKV